MIALAFAVGGASASADQLVKVVSLPGVHEGIVVSADNSSAYVTNAYASSVYKIDASSLEVLAALDVSMPPHRVALSPSGALAAVGLCSWEMQAGGVAIIDVVTFSVVRTVVMEDCPTGIAFTPDGASIVTANYAPASFTGDSIVSVSTVDAATGDEHAIDTSGRGNVNAMALHPDGSNVFLSGEREVWNVDLDDFTVTEFLSLTEQARPRGLLFDSQGRYLYVADLHTRIHRIEMADKTVDSLALDPQFSAFDLALNPVETFMYVSNWDQGPARLLKVNLHNFSVVGSTEIPQSDTNGVRSFAIAPSGEFALTGHDAQVGLLQLSASEAQSINFPTPDDTQLGERSLSLRATASSGLGVNYTSTSPDVCTIAGEGVALHALGTCHVSAHQPGGYGWLAAPDVTVSFQVLPQTIIFTANPDVLMRGQSVELRATASSGLPVSFSSETGAVCSVAGSAVVLQATGVCTITATQPGNERWDAAVPVSRSFTVFPSPPPGEAGVSINDGAPYTRTKEVQLNLVWPEYAAEARISNDGGFAASKTQTVALNDTVTWSLDDTVSGLYTKVVYVRFSGPGIDGTRTYSDDVVLDNTAPVLSSVTANRPGATSSTAAPQSSVIAAKRTQRWSVRINARDRRSGVAKVQFNGKQKARGATTLNYQRTAQLRLRKGTKKLFARVRDGAGNWSNWKRVTFQ